MKGTVEIARAYGTKGPGSGRHRFLVDRLWPRGVTKGDLGIQRWLKEVAPSTELRKWYGHDPERFAEFSRRYQRELEQPPAAPLVDLLASLATRQGVVLVTATRDLDHSGAAVLAQAVERRVRALGQNDVSRRKSARKTE